MGNNFWPRFGDDRGHFCFIAPPPRSLGRAAILPDERETVPRFSFPWETGGPGAGQEQAGAAFTLGIRNFASTGQKVSGFRPTPVRPVTVTIDGVTHDGMYYVRGSTLFVQSQRGAKRALLLGGSLPLEKAKLLLSELVRGI